MLHIWYTYDMHEIEYLHSTYVKSSGISLLLAS